MSEDYYIYSPLIEKKWGCEFWVVNNELYCFKVLHLKKGYQCSLHCHKIKDETFIIKSGQVRMEVNGISNIMLSKQQVRIKPNEYHRFTGLTDAVIIEISTQHMDSDSYRKIQSGKAE